MRFSILFLLLLVTHYSIAGEFAVSPMMIELIAKNREIKEFSFSVFGKSNSVIKLELFNMNQLESGYMAFTKLGEDDLVSMGSWVELERNNFRIRDGETVTVRGSIRVPSRAAGTHLIGVMVEEETPERERGGISVKIRYAVVIILHIEGRYNRIRTQFDELVVVHRDDGTYLEGYFLNDSAIENWLFNEVQIRGMDNRLLERVPLKTESAWQRADIGSRVFPGARVRIYGKITESFDTGIYNVLVRNNFADKSQPVYRDTIYLEAPQQDNLHANDSGNPEGSENSGTVIVDPEALQIRIRANGTSFSSFLISNTKQQEVRITFPSWLENLEEQGVSEFKFYPAALSIKPNRTSRIVLRQTHLSDSYYGDITFKAEIESDTATDDKSIVLDIRTVGGL